MIRNISAVAFRLLFSLVFLASLAQVDWAAAQNEASADPGTAGESQEAGTKDAPRSEIPRIAEIIPLSDKLTGRLAVLEKDALSLLDGTEVESRYSVKIEIHVSC